MSRLSSMNPRNLFVRTRFNYEKVPNADSQSSSPLFNTPIMKSFKGRHPWSERWRRPRMSLTRIMMLLFVSFLFVSMLASALYRKHQHNEEERKKGQKKAHAWERYPRVNGFYNGIRTLVPFSNWTSEQEYIQNADPALPPPKKSSKHAPKITEPPMDPIKFDPYPDYDGHAYLKDHEKVETCFLDEENTILPPNIYAYPGTPQNMTAPSFGDYELLGMDPNVCFDRFGRFGAYGYSYAREEGGLGMSGKSESAGAAKMWEMGEPKIEYAKVNWAAAQKTCREKNKARFRDATEDKTDDKTEDKTAKSGKKKVARHAYILRTWTGYKYTDNQILSLRAMINELSLKSGGEYDVHFLLHVKDNTIPIWASDAVYQQVIQDNLPKEFWGMATLWSEQQMKMYYPEPFTNNVENRAQAPLHSVYRSAHFALQWFSQAHPEYDFYWNWEMDLRFNGHYYEFNTGVGDWARQQPRKGMWERSARYYIPEYHGSWQNFTELVEEETFNSDEKPVWGPPKFENTGMIEPPPESHPPTSYYKDNYEWGVGEEADLITFNPIFDPAKTNWVFREDVSGYDLELPVPPRRCAIITVSRLSKRLLDIMHRETYLMKHHMFPEMWPPTVAYHHGLKAVYAPHTTYFDRDWPLKALDDTFNHPTKPTESVFGWGEHNQAGSTFYYNAGFSSALWRRWLGAKENGEGGTKFEVANTGRMCLRPILFHPIKYERGAGDESPSP